MVSSLIQTPHSTQPFTHFVRKIVQNASNHAHTISINQLQSQSKMDNEWTSNTHSALYVCVLHIYVVLHPHSKQFWLSIWEEKIWHKHRQMNLDPIPPILKNVWFCSHTLFVDISGQLVFVSCGTSLIHTQCTPTNIMHIHQCPSNSGSHVWTMHKKKHTRLVIMESRWQNQWYSIMVATQ